MKIIDKKIEHKVYRWPELSQGEVYKDVGKNYVMMTDDQSVVDMSDGSIYRQLDYSSHDAFTLLNCVLEIQ